MNGTKDLTSSASRQRIDVIASTPAGTNASPRTRVHHAVAAGHSTAREIRQVTGLSSSGCSAILRDLEDDYLVTRTRSRRRYTPDQWRAA